MGANVVIVGVLCVEESGVKVETSEAPAQEPCPNGN